MNHCKTLESGQSSTSLEIFSKTWMGTTLRAPLYLMSLKSKIQEFSLSLMILLRRLNFGSHKYLRHRGTRSAGPCNTLSLKVSPSSRLAHKHPSRPSIWKRVQKPCGLSSLRITRQRTMVYWLLTKLASRLVTFIKPSWSQMIRILVTVTLLIQTIWPLSKIVKNLIPI